MHFGSRPLLAASGGLVATAATLGRARPGRPRGRAGRAEARGGRAAGPSWASRLGAASSGQHCSAAQPLQPHALTGGQAAGTAAASYRAAGWRVSFCSSMVAPGTGEGDGGPLEAGEREACPWAEQRPRHRRRPRAAPRDPSSCGCGSRRYPLASNTVVGICHACPGRLIPAVLPAVGLAPLQQHCRPLRLPQPSWASAQQSPRGLGSRQLSESSLRATGNTQWEDSSFMPPSAFSCH